MKLLLALSALLAGVSAKKGGVRKINSAAASPKLMSKAMRYNDFIAKHGKTTRKLDQEWEITGDYSIVPQECVNFAVQTDNIYDEDVISYAANEEAVAEKSYVIFQVVQSNVAYYEDGSSDTSLSWIASLGDFMEAMVMYKSAVKENYCEQCQQAEDYCYYQKNGMTQEDAEEQQNEQEENQDQQEDQQQDEQDDQGRKLKAFERKLSGNYVNCSQCDAYSCWEEEEQDGQEQQEDDYYMADEEVANYVADFAQCAETGIMTSTGIELHAGFICGNRDGKNGGTGTYGPEIGLFLDDECTVYYKSMDYYSVATTGNQYANNNAGRKLQEQVVLTSAQLEEITSMVVDPYSSGISCEAFPEFDEWNQDGDQQEEEQNQDEQQNEANEICQQVMQADAVPLATCGYDGQEEQEEAEEEAEEEWEGNYYNFLWEYELTQDEVDDIQAVCIYYETYDFETYQGNVYEGETHYKPPKSGTFSGLSGLSAGAKWAISLIVIAVVGGAAFFALKKKKSDDDYKLEPLHDKGTSA